MAHPAVHRSITRGLVAIAWAGPHRFGDEIEGVMQWKNEPDLGPIVGKSVRLRFVLEDADLDSMRFANPGNTQYRMTYDAHGATSGWGPAAMTATVGAPLSLPSALTLAKAGSVFAGWNTAADGSGTTYAPGAAFTSTSAVTLYSLWKPAAAPPVP